MLLQSLRAPALRSGRATTATPLAARSTLRIGTLALLLLASSSATVAAQSVGVSLVPSIERVRWSDLLAFEDDDLYGGRIALRFGPLVELQPFYFTRDGYGIDRATAGERFGPSADGQSIDMRHYGTNVQFNLGTGAVTPFVRAGAGVLRLIPDSAPRQDRITVSAGGGLRFGIAGLNAEVFAEQMSFRLNPRALFGASTDTTMEGPPTLRNFVYGAAITVPLSSARNTEDQDVALRGTTAPIEPFVGQLRYASAFSLPNLEVAGVRAGFDFTPVFGLRGFYWRGVNDDRDGPAPVAGYGGEGQFNLNAGPGFSPFLIVGAGRIDFKPEFRDSLDTPRDDQSAFILGGGASVRVSDRVHLNGAIRDYIMSPERDLDQLGSTGDLTHSTMITAGLTISLGGSSSASSQTEPGQAARATSPTRVTGTKAEELERTRAALEERERMLDRREAAMRDATMRGVPLGTPMGAPPTRALNQAPQDSGAAVRGMSPSGQWITVPVPVRGEIILRYGFPTTMGSRDTVMVRRDSTVRVAPEPTSGDDVIARLSEIERRLTARLDAMERRVGSAPSVIVRETPAVEGVMVVPERALSDSTRDRSATPVFQRFTSTRTRDLQPYVGLGSEDGNVQLILGLRADLGAINPGSGIHWVPELALGVGGGTSVLAMANLQYAFNAFGGSSKVQPYVTLGGGIYSPTVLGVNTAVGTTFALQRDVDSPWFLGVELQGINLFSDTRLLFSIQRSR
jgi:hypothetical protein